MAAPYRVLHTADWHLGAAFHEQDRSADEQAALDQVIDLCAVEAIDAVIIAGDIFDTHNPSADAQQRYYQSLLAMVERGGVGAVLAIAGNHDSAGRIDAPQALLAAQRIIVRGALASDADPSDCIVTLPRRDGSPGVVAAAVPYLREQDLTIPSDGSDLTSRQAAAMHQRFAAVNLAARAQAAADGLPLLVAGHCFARSGSLGGAERPVVSEAIGNLGQVDLAGLADGAAYVALGHLHRPQRVGGHEHWRYSGSLLPTAFDQTGERRGVCLATVPADGQAATVEHRLLHNHRPYADLSGDLATVQAAIASLPLIGDGEPVGLLRCVVTLEAPRPGLAGDIAGWAQARGWRSLVVERRAPVSSDTDDHTPAYTDSGPDLTEATPEDVFAQAWHERFADEPIPAAVADAFHQLRVADADEQA